MPSGVDLGHTQAMIEDAPRATQAASKRTGEGAVEKNQSPPGSKKKNG